MTHLDPRTIMIAIVIGEAIMGGGLLAVARRRQGAIKGTSRWAAATLTHAAGWTLVGLLRGVAPDLVSIVAGNGLQVLALGLGLTALAELTGKVIRTAWVYAAVLAQSVALIYFTVGVPNVAARIVVASSCGAAFLLSGGHMLWAGRASRPVSDSLAAGLFATTGAILVARVVYTLVLNPDPNQSPMAAGRLNDLLYVAFFAIGILANFAFLLMISERYLLQRATAQALLEGALQEKGAALKRMRAQQAAIGEASTSDAFLAGDVKRLAEQVTELAARTVGVERASVRLFNEEGTELRCIDLYEATPGRHSSGGVLYETTYGPEFAALKGVRFVDADDPLTDWRTAGYVESHLKPHRITSMLDAVLDVSGQRLGLLCLEHVDKPHHWERDEVGFACQLADKIALSLVNRARRDAQETLRASETRYRQLFEAAKDGILILDAASGTIEEANPCLIDLVGYGREEILNRGIWEVGFFGGVLTKEAAFKDLLGGESPPAIEIALRTADDRRVDVELVSSLYLLQGKRVVQCNIRDITERKQGAMALEAALDEKKALLREVHHRVKNNLQVISSFLRLEGSRTEGPAIKSVLKDMQGRILSMALLHETLYRSGNFGRVDLAIYMKQLAEQLFRAQSLTAAVVRLELDLQSVQVGIDQAIPCGLIINELLTNSLKHGFRDGRRGTARVVVRPETEGRVHLEVSDDGAGLPPDLDARRGRSLGLQLVSDLSRQLGGQLQISQESSTRFVVTFTPAPAHNTGPTRRPAPGTSSAGSVP